ncbi:MAG: CpXC domain-containing protein [Anaerolineae bacterium]|nr:CpXC domain-containing protein [Anaerolineae bacterium]
MQTQLTCPQCSTPITAQIIQVINVDRYPQLKNMLLSGQLNVAQCPTCGWAGQVGTPLVYHESAHELFMAFIPSEMGLSHMDEQQLIGRLTRAIVDETPMEKRRGYMLQPPMRVMRWQTFVEKVLETEGVTAEMLADQQKQVQLLQEMLDADTETLDILIRERGDELGELAFSVLRSSMESASQSGQTEQLVKMTNLQWRLMTETETGRRLERQQLAVHALTRAAKEDDALTPGLLLEHILRHVDDDDVVDALVMAGGSALNYEFFAELSAEIENKARAHDKVTVKKLTALRTRLLAVYDEMRSASEEIVRHAADILQEVITAPDIREALLTHLDDLDETFTYVLAANIDQAEATGNEAALARLTEVQETLQELAMESVPPEIRMINDMISAESEAEARRILNENSHMVTPELAEALKQLENNPAAQGNPELLERVRAVQRMINANLALRI